jgi:hypothetical protein
VKCGYRQQGEHDHHPWEAFHIATATFFPAWCIDLLDDLVGSFNYRLNPLCATLTHENEQQGTEVLASCLIAFEAVLAFGICLLGGDATTGPKFYFLLFVVVVNLPGVMLASALNALRKRG